jgi:hypothetical protein
VSFYLRQGRQAGLVGLGQTFEEPGTVRVQGVEVFKTPQE